MRKYNNCHCEEQDSRKTGSDVAISSPSTKMSLLIKRMMLNFNFENKNAFDLDYSDTH